MSGILLTAEEAYRRYVSSHVGVIPPVRVVYAHGEITLNGLRVQPTPDGVVVAFGPAEHPLPVLVLREEDVQQVLIGDATPKFGFEP